MACIKAFYSEGNIGVYKWLLNSIPTGSILNDHFRAL